jgi:hypothetical protein
LTDGNDLLEEDVTIQADPEWNIAASRMKWRFARHGQRERSVRRREVVPLSTPDYRRHWGVAQCANPEMKRTPGSSSASASTLLAVSIPGPPE